MLSEELAVRDDRRFRNGLRLSKLPHHETLEDYGFSFQPELDPRKVKDLATFSFVEDKANVALLGSPGVGKTHIAVALAVAACRADYSIYFTSLDDMVRHLKAAEDQGRLISKLTSYLRPSVLVVDEVGYQPLERAQANLVFQVISKRYENHPACTPVVPSGRRGGSAHSGPPGLQVLYRNALAADGRSWRGPTGSPEALTPRRHGRGRLRTPGSSGAGWQARTVVASAPARITATARRRNRRTVTRD
ncbi:ATP-binding protein [Streptomyces sp. NPDC091027]|uniref:ATP-binding protein n=1 Tax=Streptomyces sp. NPDC091027 TaxID=3365971 RepID=UPI0037F5B470